ncbi:MAG: hypothetical protein LBG79_06680 [Spirochaetaceae bacterium]|jgi:cell fate regulator YaaT (PSP1 superfamily)|nr:hypothetical protein [Spirochaetaceae bacterium]GMO27524.1 MAG: regulatory iron-sulfur-containing complex subunit RicT [Termitinemataceae bacterium]
MKNDKDELDSFDMLDPDILEDPAVSEDLSAITSEFNCPIPEDASIYHLQLKYSHETFFAVYRGETPLQQGTPVVVPTRYGRDLAEVIGRPVNAKSQAFTRVTRIERVASPSDLEKAKRNKENEEHAFKVCKEKIEQRRLQMKLVKVHYILEEGKILFFFTADNRVDFRELVKDLVSVFKTRIELRQIGIRDESRIMGGCGICGRPYCCHTISDKLKPVSIKMAKEQNLSLNSMKISGSCGRLLCCLSYEHNFYIEERKNYPFEGERISWDGVIWRVRELNVIAGIVTLDSEDGRQLIIPRKRFLKVEKNGWKIT